jgi:hypothetical protein
MKTNQKTEEAQEFTKSELQARLAAIEAAEKSEEERHRTHDALKLRVETAESKLATIYKIVDRLKEWYAAQEAAVIGCLESVDSIAQSFDFLGDIVNQSAPVFAERWVILQWNKLRLDHSESRWIAPCVADVEAAKAELQEWETQNPTHLSLAQG